jgi:DNA-binding Xre family transcriptional regulator
MKEYDFSSGDKLQRRKSNHDADEKVQYASGLEERALHLISSRVPLPKVLNEICSVLDCQIGNVVSLISLPGDDVGDLEAVARNAALFGLYPFCSEGVFGESNELLGFLEMYCSVARTPNPSEIHLIARALCLAAIAIRRHNEAGIQGHCDLPDTAPVQEPLPEWPHSSN